MRSTEAYGRRVSLVEDDHFVDVAVEQHQRAAQGCHLRSTWPLIRAPRKRTPFGAAGGTPAPPISSRQRPSARTVRPAPHSPPLSGRSIAGSPLRRSTTSPL